MRLKRQGVGMVMSAFGARDAAGNKNGCCAAATKGRMIYYPSQQHSVCNLKNFVAKEVSVSDIFNAAVNVAFA